MATGSVSVIAAINRNGQATQKPIAAYQVSGEYAQLHAAAKMGWLDLPRTRHESLVAIKRAGADMILTYFAKTLAAELR
jgi:porphobilinogen synthase